MLMAITGGCVGFVLGIIFVCIVAAICDMDNNKEGYVKYEVKYKASELEQMTKDLFYMASDFYDSILERSKKDESE